MNEVPKVGRLVDRYELDQQDAGSRVFDLERAIFFPMSRVRGSEVAHSIRVEQHCTVPVRNRRDSVEVIMSCALDIDRHEGEWHQLSISRRQLSAIHQLASEYSDLILVELVTKSLLCCSARN